jgi:hypothetical protein
MAFAKELTRTLDPDWAAQHGLLDVVKKRALDALRLLLRRPDNAAVEAYGRLELQVGTTHDSKIAVAPVLTFSRLLRWLLVRNLTDIPWIYWPEATIHRSVSSKPLKIILRIIHGSRDFLAQAKASSRFG